ncbi:MAG: hypothetical protein AAGA48_00035 [Myxococcota bacterium]
MSLNKIEDLRVVLEDAWLEGRDSAVERIGVELARTLGVAQAGADRHGPWIRIDIGAASLRMRWVGPGRLRAAVQRVELTTGRWVAETPISRGLWGELMDEVPQGAPELPYSGLSWSDAQHLCRQIAMFVPALQPRLPSLAEWTFAMENTKTRRTQEEWCHDAVSAFEPITPFEPQDPLGRTGGHRVLAGFDADGLPAYRPAWGRQPKATLRVVGGAPLVRDASEAEYARAYRIALQLGRISPPEVVAWLNGRSGLHASAATDASLSNALLAYEQALNTVPRAVVVARRVLGLWLQDLELRGVRHESIDDLIARLRPWVDFDHPDLVDERGTSIFALGNDDQLVPWLRDVGR